MKKKPDYSNPKERFWFEKDSSNPHHYYATEVVFIIHDRKTKKIIARWKGDRLDKKDIQSVTFSATKKCIIALDGHGKILKRLYLGKYYKSSSKV